MPQQPVSLRAIERLDVAYALFNAERSLRLEDPQITMTEGAGLTVLRDPSRPADETYNRVVGLDEDSIDALDEALDFFDDDPPQVDVPVDRMSPRVCEALRQRDLAPARAISWLWNDPAEMCTEPIEGIDVRRLREHGQGLLMDLLGRQGAPVPPEVREKRQQYYCTDRFRAYIARVDGQPVGWATLFVHEGVGILGNAATLTEFRGRGVQSALFRARAADAVDIALAWVTVDVEPGSVSHRNAFRAGMVPRTSAVWWRRRG